MTSFSLIFAAMGVTRKGVMMKVLTVILALALAGNARAVTASFQARLDAAGAADPRNPASAQTKKLQLPQPTFENLAYGDEHPRQRMDVWLPSAAKTAKVPCVITIHGGAWFDGNSLAAAEGSVKNHEQRGYAVVTFSYRLIPDAMKAKFKPEVEWPLGDAVRAVRYVIDHADEWGIDRRRILISGGSAGAYSALYVALYNNCEFGIKVVAAGFPQTTLDPLEVTEWIPNGCYGGHAFGYNYNDIKTYLARRERHLSDIRKYSLAELIRHVDPAKAPRIVMWTGRYLPFVGAPDALRPLPGTEGCDDAVHSPIYIQKFRELCDRYGVSCEMANSRWVIDLLMNDKVKDPFDYVHERIAAGDKKITVPRDIYVVAPKDAKGTLYLELKDVQDVEIDFSGSKLVGLKRTRFLQLTNCRGVKVKNLKCDLRELGFTQALIEKVSGDGDWDVRIIPGYPVPTAEQVADGEKVWPLQAYDAKSMECVNWMRHRQGLKVEKTGADTFRITGGDCRIGKVGDIAVWAVDDPGLEVKRGGVGVDHCTDCTLESIWVHSTTFHGCGFHDTYSRNTVLRDCRVERITSIWDDSAPRGFPRLRSTNHDAMNSRFGSGVKLLNCRFAYHGDDCVNISGYYGTVVAVDGDWVRMLPAFGRGGLFEVGNTCQVMAADGTQHADVKILEIREDGRATDAEKAAAVAAGETEHFVKQFGPALRIRLDRPVDFKPIALMVSNQHKGDGFLIQNCRFGSTRARGLVIQASNGVIENNLVEKARWQGILLYCQPTWMEGGCPQNVVVRGNTVRGCGGTPIEVGGRSLQKKPIPKEAFRGVRLEDNRID